MCEKMIKISVIVVKMCFFSKYCMRIINIWVIEEFVYSVNFRKYFIVIFVDVIISGGKF